MRGALLIFPLLSGCLSSQTIYIPREGTNQDRTVLSAVPRECMAAWTSIGIGPFLTLRENLEFDCFHPVDHVERTVTRKVVGPTSSTTTKQTRDNQP